MSSLRHSSYCISFIEVTDKVRVDADYSGMVGNRPNEGCFIRVGGLERGEI